MVMQVTVILHSYLRDRFPPENKGRKLLDIAEGSTVTDLIEILGIPRSVVCAVNQQIERDLNRPLKTGDEIQFLRQSTGG